MEVVFDIGYGEPTPAVDRHVRRETEGSIFAVVVVGGRESEGRGSFGRRVLKAAGIQPLCSAIDTASRSGQQSHDHV